MIAGLSACEKSEMVRGNGLTGTWKLARTTGGFAGIDKTPGAGEVTLLKLNADKTYSTTFNSSVRASGTYILSSGESAMFGQKVNYIALGEDYPMVYEVKDHRLYLLEEMADGFNYEYVRE